MIDIQNLSFRYAKMRTNVFTDISLHIDGGKVVGLLGKNGTGKSTLLYLISGLLHPTSGTVTYKDIATNRRLPETLSNIFIVPEEFDLPSIALERYVEINLPFYPNFDHELLKSNLEMFELSTDLNLGELSMGQKKKVFMSFALATCTDLLLMDEPTNGLDIPSKAMFRKVVNNSRRPDRTIIISTHQVHDVEMLIDHIIMIDNQTIMVNTSIDDIKAKLSFEHRPTGAFCSDAYYIEPSIGGNLVVAPARPDTVTSDEPVNLELLFNALSQNPYLLS